MAYSIVDLITLFRRESEDPTYTYDRNLPEADSLWSNFELIQYIDQGQKEFARRTLCFKDSLSFRPTITADSPWIKYDDRILRIEKAELNSTNIVLPVLTMEDFHTQYFIDDYGNKKMASWETRTGTPRCLIRDMEQDYLRAYPIPTEDDTLLLTVRRLPMEDITNLTDEIEISNRWRYGLLHKLKSEAYNKPKALMLGFEKASFRAELDWDKWLNEARSRMNIRTRGPGQVRYGGIV